MSGFKDYVSQSYDELKNHVSWPSYEEAQKLTVIVLVFTIVMALAIWGVDTVFSSAIEQYFKWVKG